MTNNQLRKWWTRLARKALGAEETNRAERGPLQECAHKYANVCRRVSWEKLLYLFWEISVTRCLSKELTLVHAAQRTNKRSWRSACSCRVMTSVGSQLHSGTTYMPGVLP